MSDDPVAPADSSSSQSAPPASRWGFRKRVVIVPLVLAALVPAGWGASVVASPVVAHAQMKSDLANAGEQVKAAQEAAGEYREPVFVTKQHEGSLPGMDIPADSFGPVVVGDRTQLSSTEVRGDEFCLTGYVDAVGHYEDAFFYSSSTGKVSQDASGCLNQEGDGDTYKCLPATAESLRNDAEILLASPEYREAAKKYSVILEELMEESTPEDMLDVAQEHYAHDPSLKEYFNSFVEEGQEVIESTEKNDALSVLSSIEAEERRELAANSPENTQQSLALDAVNDFLGDDDNYGPDGSFLPGKKDQAQELYEKAEAAVDDYVGVMCN